MVFLPAAIVACLKHFAPLFSRRTWRHVPLLVVGALLAPGQRMVSSVLRAVGLEQTPTFQTYHRVLNRAVWSSLGASRNLLRLLVAAFIADDEPLVLGIDETIERRRGKKIAAAGIYRDPVRSSHSHFVKVNGLRWVCLLLLAPIPWAGRVWALPFLTALAPSERYAQERQRRHKPVTVWARQLIRQVHRWVPERRLVVVGDRGYAALELLAAARPVATLVTRLRLDAHLCAPPPPRAPRQTGRPRLVGQRLPPWSSGVMTRRRSGQRSPSHAGTVRHSGRLRLSRRRLSGTTLACRPFPFAGRPSASVRDPQQKFATQAILCTDQEATPLQILSWFVLRWQVEVTFHAARAHLGGETQRQGSERAIARTTPALLGLFSLVTLLAHDPMMDGQPALPQTAWYTKTTPTFSDALALVRKRLWTQMRFPTLANDPDVGKVPRTLLDHLADLLCYAA